MAERTEDPIPAIPRPRAELASLLATAYLRVLQRAHKSRIQATLEPKTTALLSCYAPPPE